MYVTAAISGQRISFVWSWQREESKFCFRLGEGGGADGGEEVGRIAHLKEVDLNGAVGEVQDDGALGSEPKGEVWQSCQLVSFPPGNVGTSFQQVLAHVVAEIFQQGYLQNSSNNNNYYYHDKKGPQNMNE